MAGAVAPTENAETAESAGTGTAPESSPTGKKGPLMGVIWFLLTLVVYAAVAGTGDYRVVHLVIGWRSMLALAGYLIMCGARFQNEIVLL
jgi:uncharacterized membrane protein